MNRLISSLKKMPKRYLLLGAVLGTTVLGITALGGNGKASWGPDRPTYTMNAPADHVTFNSITDNPNYGDERTFFDAYDAAGGTTAKPYDQIKVADGQEIVLRAYVHNDASSNFNGTDFKGTSVARNTRVQITLPKNTGTALRSMASIMADNANNSSDPNSTTAKMVQDTADFYADQPFTVEYVPGSAMASSNAVPNGYKLNDSIVSDANGALIGYKGPDGIVPGCMEYTQLVTIHVKIKMQVQPAPKITLEKTVRKLGDTAWVENVSAKPGDTLEYRLKVNNVGNTQMTGMVVGDRFPQHLTYVKGSTKLFDTSRPSGENINDGITEGALSFTSTYDAGTQAFIAFKATVNNDYAATECGSLVIHNVGTARTKEVPTEIEDAADVTVTTGKACVQAVYICDSLAITQTEKQVKMIATSSATNADITGYTFVTTDATGKVVDQKTVTTSATSATNTITTPAVSKYTVKVTLHTSKGDAPVNEKCNGSFEVKETTTQETPVYSCDGLQVAAVGERKVRFTVLKTATNGAVLKSVTYDFGDKSTPLTTNASDMTTRDYEYSADGEYVARVKLTFTVNGQDQVVSTDKCAAVVKINTVKPVPTPTPTTPVAVVKTLPSTGAGEVLGVFVSVAAAGAILYYLTALRRNNEN